MGLGLLAHRAMRAGAAVMPKLPPVHTKPALNGLSLARFVDPLPIAPIAKPVGTRARPDDPTRQIPFYRIEMREFHSQLHRDLKPARQWGFNGIAPGPTFIAKAGAPFLVEWANALPDQHFLPLDHHLHGAEKGLPESRTVVHLHGAKVPPESDGYPENWYAPGKSATTFYPNGQDAAMLWYHDHAMGINRLNIFAGLAGTYIIHDDVEAALNLPSGQYEIPLVISDRMLDTDSQLLYPVSADPDAPWVPEFFGDIMMVNGKAWPYLEVEPRKYRLRVLNAANARFFRFSFSDGRPFHQIGTDLGLLPAPVEVKSIVMAPAERADLIVDFSARAGQRINLRSESFDIMQFRVGSGSVKETASMPAALRAVPKTPESDALQSRMLSLAEIDNPVAEPMTMLLGGKRWMDPITEKPRLNSTEIWNLINITDDAHPIHLHLVRFQILDRRRIDRFQYLVHNKLRFTGDPIAPEPYEAGWKDTVRANPNMMTRIIVRFEGYVGRYVWHCHILEHEDNEMMRPYEVVG